MVLFATYINDTISPGTPIAVVKVLGRLGCRVVFPKEQTCCGQMLASAGYFKKAVPTVKSYARVFEDYDYVIGPSGLCTGVVRHQYPTLAGHVRDKSLRAASEELVKRIYDFTEFLASVLGLTDVGAYFPHRTTYHPIYRSVRVAYVGDRPYKLLKTVRGIDLVPSPDSDQYCGFGGTSCVKNFDMPVAMGADKARNVMPVGTEYLVTGDNACLVHIGRIMHRIDMGVKIIRLAEILAHTEEAVV